ncbi:MAG: histidine phosphatase family protein [Rikenellaceae bacterium]
MASIYLQRHTRPDIDPKICYGVSDIDLDPEFEEKHLPQVVERLRGVEADKIYSSPLQRCRRLALKIWEMQQDPCKEDLIIDQRLLELNFGEWELTPWDDIFETEEGKAWFEDYLNATPPRGGSFKELVAAAKEFLTEVGSSDQDVIAVTHSGFIRAAMVAAGRISLEEAFSIKIEYGDLIEI